jgi:Na+-driven multidrug efflux pump
MIFLGTLAVGFLVLAGPILRLFTAEPEVIAHGANCLRYISYGYIFYAWGMVIVQAFNGAGDTWTPTIINFACQWVFQIPLAWFLAFPAGMEATGVFLAITIAESSLALVGLWLFRRGRWKVQKI